MKERSKTAARSRREKENAEFGQLAKLLPLPSSITSHLDKASVIRLCTSYLKMRQLFPSGLGEEWGAELPSAHGSPILRELSSHLLFSLDGFVFILDPDGKVIYVSETASVHLGLSQIEMTGNSIYDFVHLADCDEMRSILNRGFPSQQKCFHDNLEIPLNFCLRMRCVLAKRNAGLAMDGYKVIHYNGYLKLKKASDGALSAARPENGEVQNHEVNRSPEVFQQYRVAGLVAIGQSLPSTSITDVKMSSQTFMFRTGLDFSLIYVDARITELAGYEPQKLLGKSLFQFVHCSDCVQLQMDHRSLLIKGQVITKYYRLLTRNGGWIWIQSYCTIINNNRAAKLNTVVTLNHVISGPECFAKVFDAEQIIYEDVRDNNGITTKSTPCSKRSQKTSLRTKPEGLLPKDAGSYLVNCSSNGNTTVPEIYASNQFPFPIRENGSRVLPEITNSTCKISSKRKSPSPFVFQETCNKSKAQKRNKQCMNVGQWNENNQLMNTTILGKLNQGALNNFTHSSESSGLEQNVSMVNNYSISNHDVTPYTKPKRLSMPENGTIDTIHSTANRDLKVFCDNQTRKLFPTEIHNSEFFCDFKSPVASKQTFVEQIRKCDKDKIGNCQPIRSSEMTKAVCFNENNTNTKKKARKLKTESKTNSKNLKRNSASSSICFKQQPKFSSDSSYEENNLYSTNVFAAKNVLPESKIGCIDECTTTASNVQERVASTTNFNRNENGIMRASNIPSSCFNNILDLQRNPAVPDDGCSGVMVHSACYDMLRAASNNSFRRSSDSSNTLYNGNHCNSGDSSDLNAKFVLSDNAGYTSPSFSPIIYEDVNPFDQSFLNCSDSKTHCVSHDGRTISSSEISTPNIPSYLEYESFSAASTPLSIDLSTDNSSVATTSIDSDYQVFSYEHQSALDLNAQPPDEKGADISETEITPFDKPAAMFTDLDNQSSTFPFDIIPCSEHMLDDLTALVSENESFPEVDCEWLANPCLVGDDLTVLRRSFSGTLREQTY